MDNQRLFRGIGWSTVVAGALMLSACSSSSNGDGSTNKDATTGDGSTGDGGPSGNDATTGDGPGGGNDATPRDTGPRDGGGRDAMPPDTGMVDPTPNAEGHTCTPGMTGQGSCTDPMAICATWTPMNATTQLSTCLRQCNATADCAGSTVGNVCAGVAFPDQNFGVIKACVSAAINVEGDISTASLLRVNAQGAAIPMTGCAEGLVPVERLSASLLLDLEYDQHSCARLCAANGDCMAAAPNCTLSVYTSTAPAATKKGLCTTRRAGKGAKCSERKATEICDTGASNGFVCLDIGLNDADNMAVMAQGDLQGVCLEVCDMTTPTCMAKADPVLTGTCKFGFFTSPTLGLCSDGCSSFPDNCTGAGSPPPTGGTAHGETCHQFRGTAGTIDMPEESLCIDVEQTGPLFDPLTNFMMLPAVNCSTNGISCPDKTVCIGLGNAAMNTACVYGCNTTTATTGCRGTMTSTCAKVFGATANAGVCSL